LKLSSDRSWGWFAEDGGNGPAHRNLLAPRLLEKIGGPEVGALPGADERLGRVARAVIADEPRDVAERLCGETAEDALGVMCRPRLGGEDVERRG